MLSSQQDGHNYNVICPKWHSIAQIQIFAKNTKCKLLNKESMVLQQGTLLVVFAVF